MESVQGKNRVADPKTSAYLAFERNHADLKSELLADLRVLREPVPTELFHYTTSRGLLGILERGCIWASNLKYMNDFSELVYGQQLVLGVLQERKQEYKSPEMRKFFELATDAVMALGGRFEVYGFCLCEDGNLLSQWREYAQGGNGYAIGFNAEFIEKTLAAKTGTKSVSNLMLVKVCYDQQRQRHLAEMLLTKMLNRLEKDISDPKQDVAVNDLLAHFTGFLAGRLAPYVVSFKSDAFREENEWRALYANIDPRSIPFVKFREARGYVVPYFEFVAVSDKDEITRLPLSSIVQGPHVDPEAGKTFLKLLLEKHSYDHVEIKHSRITLRKP